MTHPVKLDDVVGFPAHGRLSVGEGARRGRGCLVLVHLFAVLVVDAARAFHNLSEVKFSNLSAETDTQRGQYDPQLPPLVLGAGLTRT